LFYFFSLVKSAGITLARCPAHHANHPNQILKHQMDIIFPPKIFRR
jgi:hypothetical protein